MGMIGVNLLKPKAASKLELWLKRKASIQIMPYVVDLSDIIIEIGVFS
jgi:hypothetical protein